MTEREKVAHLLRRFGLGASEAELEYYGKGTLKEAIDKLIDYEQTDEGFDVPIQQFKPANQPLVPIQAISAHWYLRLLSTRRPLQEKLTLFWHDHFATSASKVNVPPLMYQQNETLRRHATGSFAELLLEMSQDPAMIFWLDNQFNVKGKPNENFAREVMELFTLGVGNYSEQDVQEAARDFTGWTYRQMGPLRRTQTKAAEFSLRSAQHDDGPKTLFGKSGAYGGEDVVKMLCDNPQTARYLTTKVWEWFVYPKPDPKLVEGFATKFMASGLNIKSLLRAIMESPEFYSDRAYRAVYKTPVDFVYPCARQLGIGEATIQQFHTSENVFVAARGVMAALQQATKGMGMDLLFPPDVAGWEGGQGWISSATMVERIQWGERLFGQGAPGGRRAQLRVAAYGLFTDTSPEGIVEKLISIFDAPIPVERRETLVKTADKACGGRLTPQNANQTAAAVARLIFGTPEFQMN